MIKKNNSINDIERWEHIPKAKLGILEKKSKISSDFKKQSDLINSDWNNSNNKSLRILKNIYINNIEKVKNNQIRTSHNNLYNIICDKEILRLAYRKLSDNKGAMTPGSENITANNINDSFLQKLSEDLKNEKFVWNPLRRIYVEKSGKKNIVKKKRPLGINDYKNKIVQEAIRMILESIYEPEFVAYETNSGFRSKRDCPNAIEKIKINAQFANLAIEGDIVGAFDNVNHTILFNIIKKRIKDSKFLKLLYKSFKAGIIEDHLYIDTYMGVSQGGICSPILFNIYMHEFDIFMIEEFPKIISMKDPNSEKSRSIKENSEYKKYRNRRKKCENDILIEKFKPNIIDKDIKTLFTAIRENKELFKDDIWTDIMSRGKKYDKKIYKNSTIDASVNLIKEEIEHNSNLIQKDMLLNYSINKLSEEIKINNLKLKSTSHGSIQNSKVLMFYHRYADDWTLWLKCTEDFAKEIKNIIKTFLKEKLVLDLSEEKTKITILNENQVRFLGFSIYKNKNVKIIKRKFKNAPVNNNSLNTRINDLKVDLDRTRLNDRYEINGFYEIIKYFDRKDMIKPKEIGWLTIFEIQQIIEKFNQFMLEFGNYYITVISEPSRISRYIYILYYSCLKTLCCKLKISTKKLTQLFGYHDISDRRDFNHILSNKDKKENFSHTDLRICYKYEFNNKNKWIVLYNYKELMSILLKHRSRFIECYNKKVEFLTSNIDFFTLYKLNFRTRYKMTSHCIICGSSETLLHNYHIKKIKYSGNLKLRGYKSFDKLVVSLNRKQIIICSLCHGNIHKGIYNGLKFTDLYDVRLALPENFIKINSDNHLSYSDFISNGEKNNKEIKDNIKFIINEEEKTYWNKEYNNYLLNNNIKFSDIGSKKIVKNIHRKLKNKNHLK
jgi:retron-type reverse transcriptase